MTSPSLTDSTALTKQEERTTLVERMAGREMKIEMRGGFMGMCVDKGEAGFNEREKHIRFFSIPNTQSLI